MTPTTDASPSRPWTGTGWWARSAGSGCPTGSRDAGLAAPAGPDDTGRVIPPEQTAREQQLTDEVVASFAGTPDARLHAVLTSLVTHLHAFARDVRLTEAEWAAGIEFLTTVGHRTDDRRQEFVLLSDVLGFSMQIVTVNDAADDAATEATVLGPFFVDGAPEVGLGGDLGGGAPGEPCWVEGTVTGVDGDPVADARLDVWEADSDGLYDVQRDGGATSARGVLHTDDEGNYRFWCVTPTPYPIPTDGPVGAMLQATARSAMRAPHLHVKATAPGYRTLVTHVFVAGGEVVHDSVFGVRESLLRDFERSSGPTPDGRAVDGTWTRCRFDLNLAPA